MVTNYVLRTAGVCFVLTMALTGSAAAQDYWMYPGEMNSVSLQVFKPSFSDSDYREYDFFTSTWVLSAKIRASDNVAVFVSLPASNVVWRYVEPSEDWVSPTLKLTMIGNPYLGFEIGGTDTGQAARPVGRIGLRPPVASDRKYLAAYTGAQTLFNSFEGLTPDLWTLQLGMGTDLVSRTGVGGSINIDAAIMIPTEDGPDTEVFGNYNLCVTLSNSGFRGSMGFAGRIWMTEGDMDFSERTAHQLGFEAGYQMGSFRPGAHLRVPLDDDLSHYIDNVYGVSLTFNVK